MILVFIRNSVQNEFAYRVNLIVSVLLTLVGMVGAVGAVLVVYSHASSIQGWTLTETLALLGLFSIMSGLLNTFISPNLDQFAENVRQGTLDFVLLKPVNSQFLVSFQRCVVWGLADVVAGAAVLVYALASGMGEGVGVGDVLAFGLAAAAGTAIIYSLWVSLATVAFWTVKIDNMTTILRAFFEMGRFPVDVYPLWLRRALTYLVPIAFVTTTPVEALGGRSGPVVLTVAVLLAGAMLYASTRLWRLGLSQYTSASS